ncbi:hypothetical protein [Vineibacter terrae]|uniref:hypothetical protein n=1 Tax=Vineibacter terrae TaxID=2586908 RepID=UPI002E346D08|nr:hypothetical protein [Vineibacter terrae]HEX2888415.1 hypothetical protein [Vineibacter terrae]
MRPRGGFVPARAKREGFAFDDAIEAVFERFSVVWPPDAGDAPMPHRRHRDVVGDAGDAGA